MKLTDTTLRNVKPNGKRLKLSDGGGLYLLVKPNGSKLWRLKYRFGGKETSISLGSYSEVSLREARERREEAKRMLAQGLNPSQERRVSKEAALERAENNFESVASEWYSKKAPGWTESHGKRVFKSLQNDVFPWLGARPIAEITAPELLTVLRRIEQRQAIETAHRVLQRCGQVFRYAVVTGRIASDPTRDLKGALPPSKEKHHPTILDPEGIGGLLRAMDTYKGSPVTRAALNLAPLVFVRPGELRKAEWSEIDLERAEWRIPAQKMKMRELHIVPLSRQAVAILRDLKPLTGGGRYLFPGARSNGRPMSENTVNGALRRLGYDSKEMTGHGFRSMACSLLNEQGWPADAIERQLAHSERDTVRAAYNRGQYLEERRRMMQAWADYLDGLKDEK